MTTTSIRPAESAPARIRRLRNPLAAFTGFPKAIWVIFAGTVVNRIGFLVGPFLVFFLGSAACRRPRPRTSSARWGPATWSARRSAAGWPTSTAAS
ncbi:hypothetical protein ACFQ9X_02430 [Catenulispora yoronensis]